MSKKHIENGRNEPAAKGNKATHSSGNHSTTHLTHRAAQPTVLSTRLQYALHTGARG